MMFVKIPQAARTLASAIYVLIGYILYNEFFDQIQLFKVILFFCKQCELEGARLSARRLRNVVAYFFLTLYNVNWIRDEYRNS